MSVAWLWLLLCLLATACSRAADHPWGDWIIVDDAEPGTSILLRRITPKSVFVAPSFNGCSEGYSQDSQGRCVKVVKINQQAQWNFFLERLNSMYASSSTSKKPQKEAGPFHINLPIGSSESSQEETLVKKRVPPNIRGDPGKVQFVPTTTLRQPPTTVQDSTTTEVTSLPTMVDSFDVVQTTTEREDFQTDSTTDSRRVPTTVSLFDANVMLGDQPIEDVTHAESEDIPKFQREKISAHQSEKPFVIIVTNQPTTTSRTEDMTTNFPTTSINPENEEYEEISDTPSTTEPTTELNSRFTTDNPPRTTEFDESFSDTKDIAETSVRPTVRYPVFPIRPKCNPAVVQMRDSSDCEPGTELISNLRRVVPTNPVPFEPNTPVKFPSESVVPVRKTQTHQSFVRFPGSTNPHDDRPSSYWWPSWQVRQQPGVGGWPPSDSQPSEQIAYQHQYPPFTAQSWQDATAWRRRFFRRD